MYSSPVEKWSVSHEDPLRKKLPIISPILKNPRIFILVAPTPYALVVRIPLEGSMLQQLRWFLTLLTGNRIDGGLIHGQKGARRPNPSPHCNGNAVYIFLFWK
jgi:hypothetical protein